MPYKILLVEDDEFKRQKIQDFLSSEKWCESLTIAVSVSGAINELDEKIFDVILLDMAIPNLDDGADGAQGLGGLAVFRYVQMISKHTSVIVVTQFETLKEGSTVVDISTLENLLKSEFKNQFRGLARYLTDTDAWKKNISEMIEKLEK
jgi:CheY-like chemotaxis protein